MGTITTDRINERDSGGGVTIDNPRKGDSDILNQSEMDDRYLRETTADARYLLESNNLSDLTDASVARTNLGVRDQSTGGGLYVGQVFEYSGTAAPNGSFQLDGSLVQGGVAMYPTLVSVASSRYLTVSGGNFTLANVTVSRTQPTILCIHHGVFA